MDLFSSSPSKFVPKGTILHHAGDVYRSGYKVIKGCLKSYVIDESGKQHILQFAPEDWFISDMDSFLNQIPSVIFIEAIEDTEVLILKNLDPEEAFGADLEHLKMINSKLRNSLVASNRRLIGLLSSSAKDRYRDFTNVYPMLVQRLPLKLIASYIGITPEYLSEIRRNIVAN